MPEPNAPKAKKRPVLLAVTAIAVVAGGGALAYFKPWARPVPTVVVERRTLQDAVEVSGTVEAAQAVTIKAETAGSVARLLAPENRAMAANAPLLAFDDAQARLTLDQARANAESSLAQARTQLRNALASQAEISRRQHVALTNLRNRVGKAESALAFLEGEVARHETLLAEGAVSAQSVASLRQQLAQGRLDLKLARDELARTASGAELVSAGNAVAQARTAVATAERQGKAAVRLAEKALADATIHAPFAGTVTDWLVDPGAWATPGTPLAEFKDLADLRLALPVDELDLPKLRLGGQVAITFDAFPEQTFEGTIATISRASVTGTGNVQVFPVDVRFSDAESRIRPGMSGDARIVVRELKDVLAVPVGAVRRQLDAYMVTVVRDGKPEDRKITPGTTTLEFVEVKDGLTEGERVQYAAAAAAAASPKP